MHLTDAGVAFLTGIPLALFYVTFGLPISWLADRSTGATSWPPHWSSGSAFTVLVRNVANLLAISVGRIGVGVGEAGGLPPSSASFPIVFPAERRPRRSPCWLLDPNRCLVGRRHGGAVAHAYGWRAVPAVGDAGSDRRRRRLPDHSRTGARRLDAAHEAPKPSMLDSPAIPVEQRAAVHVLMTTGVCPLWLGADLADAHVLDADL